MEKVSIETFISFRDSVEKRLTELEATIAVDFEFPWFVKELLKNVSELRKNVSELDAYSASLTEEVLAERERAERWKREAEFLRNKLKQVQN